MIEEKEVETQFTVRCSLDIRRKAEAVAKEKGWSLNEWMRRAINEKLSRDAAGIEDFNMDQFREIAREEALKVLADHAGTTKISSKGIGNKQSVHIGSK